MKPNPRVFPSHFDLKIQSCQFTTLVAGVRHGDLVCTLTGKHERNTFFWKIVYLLLKPLNLIVHLKNKILALR